MWRASAVILLAGVLSCKARPDARASGDAQASGNAQVSGDTNAPGTAPASGGAASNLGGTWRIVGIWVNGKPSALTGAGRTWTFQDSTLTTAAEGKIDQRGKVEIDSASSPHRLDFFLQRGAGTGTLVRRQIYQLANDTLTVAYALQNSAQAHPRSFDVTKGVVKLKLVKTQ
jgi:uncharacterized protein (TIGR03067 family)